MANKRWYHIVSFDGFWNLDIPVEEKGKRAAKELEKLVTFFKDDCGLECIIEEFKSVTGDGDAFTPEEEFDANMHSLYDWADNKRIWISTNF